MLPIHPLAHGMENFCVFSAAFTKEDCDRIKDIGELFEFKKASIGTSENSVTDAVIRKTDVSWIEPEQSSDWMFSRYHEVVQRVNWDKYQMDLRQFDSFQYSKYKLDAHYDWHIDTHHKPRGGMFRKLSCVLALTEPDEYEGGDLLIADSGAADRAHHLRPAKGDMVVFYSHVAHKVEPVTKGTRLTLVTWAMGPKIV